MNIELIDEAIYALENSETTVENVSELSALYIVRANMLHPLKSSAQSVEKELNDILPNYLIYIDVKRDYQMKKTTEGEVIRAIKTVCKELSEFIDTMYSSTDMNKERLCIKNMLKKLHEKYTD